MHFDQRSPGYLRQAHCSAAALGKHSVRKLTEASFASDRLPSSSVDSLSSSSRSSEALMASVTTEMLMGTSVSFQASAEHIQHARAGEAATNLRTDT